MSKTPHDTPVVVDMTAVIAAVAIVVHVLNYNLTAQVEHKTRVFTRLLGRHAVYYYAVYLILSALARDYFIDVAMAHDGASLVFFPPQVAQYIGIAMFVFGLLLNAWTLKALGIKGMYNGDSFGFLMDAPVTGGPYQYFQDPQYVGTAVACLGYAVRAQSLVGYLLAAWMWIVFQVSVKFIEGPHLARLYANHKPKTDKKSQ
ncbi:hypothetical protein AMAG_08441 [Allomyces macrogynus ATCC 38327]|uniref:Phosphatidyl-N-methylethanolamine N-methyltransferase n=1 Tax=Allomyces macrogynus (strain ATCC 38327) TaxID=578462 RepID=A0A0L0SL61_ALLM3|nr:hypothetical protein AMAG_08441 [Allomyces macrogynus ATCC 38327]|eukprot:KNE63301.1 hypothetical protein AMAG_08441 [Allomyces macrogynus ATCC 38327]